MLSSVRTGPLAKRCTTSSLSRSPSNRPRTPRPLSAPRSKASSFLVARGKVQLFQGALQVILSHIERSEAEKVDLGDFLPQTEQDVSKLLERLRSTLLRLTNPHLRALGECFLMDDDFVRSFSKA